VESVALIFRPAVDQARQLAERCRAAVECAGYEPRLISAWDLGPHLDRSGVRLAVTFGGDGTIIRAARWLAGSGTPILGVAMGKLGFMTELPPETACEQLPSVLAGNYWLDERVMLSARLQPQVGDGAGGEGIPGAQTAGDEGPFIALNDIVIGRGSSLRVAHIDVSVDGVSLAHYVADALVVATPTGSTAYALAAGGPVLAPDVQALVVVPVAAHLTVLRSLVVPISSRIEVRASSDYPTLVALDGQVQVPLRNDQPVTVELATERTFFARLGGRTRFYETLVPSLKKR
jgi:NAD+ kinase